ncbi:beta-Ig-H3/Fasciclin [Drepanopeziza brunnea f. sp. 'multigermtubi' MB_m1]|uniref:Beta-Ig-H3/Fasciclin n=1 Tax=Marssonina brunnea f. sp. multigermtubi (strain MB_m1) TaxID=1072389 RepID=K1XER5_MARBU|nr:beta-Ig-H3/Fasciclin [Drepanopeziza brunnea f. sp. 'multigermtubi' MB_m1]EKD19413.1 beta-Ig-H3/Fasciclin [Drepanopeziza brunnea f. sp. 'multigermtubi' MB_m1]
MFTCTPFFFLAAAWATGASAQTDLTSVLAANSKMLSTLTGLLQNNPTLADNLDNLRNVTILAPSNDAFSKFMSTSNGEATTGNTARVTALLQYHTISPKVLNGTHNSSGITTTPAYVSTHLTSRSYTNVTGGQVVRAEKTNNKVTFMSGLKEMSTVTKGDITFRGGTLHIIDRVLTIPMPVSRVALDSNLRENADRECLKKLALAGALRTSNLVYAFDNSRDLTILAPSNTAFQRIGSAASDLTNDTGALRTILEYHVLNRTLGYAGRLRNRDYPSVMGSQVRVQMENRRTFANSAQVVITDILVANGVMHVVDNVLNPSNTEQSPNPTATTQSVAFQGVTSVPSVPFTSGVSATTTAPSASTKTAAAVRVEGAVGVAALLDYYYYYYHYPGSGSARRISWDRSCVFLRAAAAMAYGRRLFVEEKCSLDPSSDAEALSPNVEPAVLRIGEGTSCQRMGYEDQGRPHDPGRDDGPQRGSPVTTGAAFRLQFTIRGARSPAPKTQGQHSDADDAEGEVFQASNVRVELGVLKRDAEAGKGVADHETEERWPGRNDGGCEALDRRAEHQQPSQAQAVTERDVEQGGQAEAEEGEQEGQQDLAVGESPY